MAGFSKSAPQHPRADYLAGTVKLNMKVIWRLLNNNLFCQPFGDHTDDAARNVRYLPFTAFVTVVRQLNLVKKFSNTPLPP